MTTPQRFSIDTKSLFLTYPQNNTPKEIAMDRIKEHFKENLNSAIIAQELHKDGHQHLHVYIKLNNPLRTKKANYLNFIADKQGNYQSCKKSVDVIKYVSKSGDYITYNIDVNNYLKEVKTKKAVQSKGIFKQITDKITITTEYKEILLEYPDICLQHGKKIKEYIQDYKTAHKPTYRNWEMNVEYHYGDTGTGKSQYAFKDFNPETHYVLRKANGENNVWWDGYTGQETVIIDDFTPKSYRLSYMLNLLDRYAMTIDTKGGSTQMLAKNIIITSNYNPEDLYTKEDCKEHKNALLRRINTFKQYLKESKQPIQETIQQPIHKYEEEINISEYKESLEDEYKEQCKKELKAIPALKRTKTNLLIMATLPYKCDKCENRYASLTHLSTHNKKEH